MKVHIVISIEKEYWYGDDCPSTELKIVAYPNEKVARLEDGIYFYIDTNQLPKYPSVKIEYPTKPKGYDKWYLKNGKWANRVAPYLGLGGFPKQLYQPKTIKVKP